MSRKRILFVSEASYLHSGFGTYYGEIIKRLHETDKYEIAEFASYAFIKDQRGKGKINWTFYANAVDEKDPRAQLYNARPVHQFGEWRFDRVLLDFKPDIVFAARDFWMDSYIRSSPLRRFFYWIEVPTVDSHPQPDEWVDVYMNADAIFTYNDWSLEILKEQSGGKIHGISEAPPAIDSDIFSPVEDKASHRKSFGLPEDAFIIGTAMRNQKRKLFPDLMSAFAKFLDIIPKEIAKKTYLYLHTSYPDIHGWDIPTLIKEFNLYNHIYFTYVCKVCNKFFCAKFRDARTTCDKCHNIAAVAPSVGYALSKEDFRKIFCLFDIYCQCATNEGFGVPQLEAAYCGIPVMSTDYSAMTDVVRKLGGYPIKVKTLVREISDMMYKAVPDQDDMVNIWQKFFIKKTAEERAAIGKKTRELALKNYNWQKTAKIIEEHIDNIKFSGYQGKWGVEPTFINDKAETQENGSEVQKLEDIFNKLLGPLNLQYGYLFSNILKDLNCGGIINLGKCSEAFDLNKLITSFRKVAENYNICEKCRVGQLIPSQEDYITYKDYYKNG